MKKLFALLLAVIMLLSMVACAEVENTKDDDEETTTEEKKESKTEEETEETEEGPEAMVVGDWRFYLDLGPQMKATLEANATSAPASAYMDYTKMSILMFEGEFTANGKFEMSIDADDLKEEFKGYGEVVAEGMDAYLKATTGKGLQEATGMTKDEYAETVISGFDVVSIANESVSGTWKVEGMELTMTPDDPDEDAMTAELDTTKGEMTFELPGNQGFELKGVRR